MQELSYVKDLKEGQQNVGRRVSFRSDIEVLTYESKTAPTTKIHTYYGKNVADQIENIAERAWSEEELESLERKVNYLKTVLSEMYDK